MTRMAQIFPTAKKAQKTQIFLPQMNTDGHGFFRGAKRHIWQLTIDY